MVYCFAFGCNHQSLREHCKFFRFPLRDANLLNQWRTACRRADREPNQYDRLCSCHFKDAIKENGPTIFPGVAAAAASGLGGRHNGGGMRRKRLRLDFVSYGVQNGKVKRLGKEVTTGGAPGGASKEEAVSNTTAVKKESSKSSPRPSPALPPPPPPACDPSPNRDLIKWQRTIDRVRCLAFREARDAGAAFISVRWVADRLNRSPAFVKKHWRGRYSDCCPLPMNDVAVPAASLVKPAAGLPSRDTTALRLTLPLAGDAVEDAVGSPSTATGVQTDGLTDEPEMEGLQEDWDPILEERNVIQGLLSCAAADKGGGLDAQLNEGFEPALADPGHENAVIMDGAAAMSRPRRLAQRGKTTPRTRTEALVEKNEGALNGTARNGHPTLEEEEEEEGEEEEEEEEEEEGEENAPLKCGQCSRKFSTTVALERHMCQHGVSVGPFSCQQCGALFAKRRGLVRHLRVHGGEPRYCCETCGKGFAQRTNLEKHRRLHTGERAYACRLCDRKFMEREHLSSHMLQHSGVRPYGCEFCEKRFKMQCHLVSHLRSHVPPLLAAQTAE